MCFLLKTIKKKRHHFGALACALADWKEKSASAMCRVCTVIIYLNFWARSVHMYKLKKCIFGSTSEGLSLIFYGFVWIFWSLLNSVKVIQTWTTFLIGFELSWKDNFHLFPLHLDTFNWLCSSTPAENS